MADLKRVAGVRMTNGLKDVIKRLEHQRTAIERALTALREVDGTVTESNEVAGPVASPRRGRAKRKGGMTPEGRRRLSEALKKRWAVKRAGSSVQSKARPAKATKKAAARKGGITAEGRQRLSEALRKRWAAKRAGRK
jgi:hypothetical protein